MLSGSSQVSTLTQNYPGTAPTCRFNPPTVNGSFAYTTYACANSTYSLDASQLFCIPPLQPSMSTLSLPYACLGTDVLSGSSCTPVPIIYAPTAVTSYSCPIPPLPTGTVLNTITNLCNIPPTVQAPTVTSSLMCGSNAQLNASNMCVYVSIPALNVAGQYTCPPLYTVGSGATAGWCIPTPQTSYPATWNKIEYLCLNGGHLGLNAAGQPNGLCYLP